MKRPVTIFTGQWADLTLETVAQKAKSFGYDGLELACWGDNAYGQTNAPAGRYVHVTSGDRHSCAIREDGMRTCWGAVP